MFREELANTRTPPARDVDHLDPAAAAREEGVSKRRLMAEQQQVLKEAQKVKKDMKKAEENKSVEFSEVKVALNESIDVSNQKKLLEAFNEEKREEDRKKKAQQEEAKLNVEQHAGQARGPSVQKQNSWHPGSDKIYDQIHVPSDRSRLPHQNERAAANVPIDHERIHQQQGGPGGYPAPTYSQTPQDHDPHRGSGQIHNSKYPPHHGNTRPESVQQPQPQHDMRRVNSHNQMTPQNTVDPDYDNWDIVNQCQRNDLSNQLPQGNQQQANPVYPQQPGAQLYHNVQYQQPPPGRHFGSDANTIYIPPNNEAYGYQPHHDTPGGHHQNTPPQVPQEYNASVESSNHYNLTVGSTVQVASVNPNDPPRYGVIRWTGRVAGVDGRVAGIELVSLNICLTILIISLLTGGLHGWVY